MKLSKLFSVDSQFQRSINIASDFTNKRILDNFIITPLIIKVAKRLLSGIKNQNNQCAWTITGPYGAGKSASLLFIMQILGLRGVEALYSKLHNFAPELEQNIQDALPKWPNSTSLIIPLIGTKEPLSVTFLRGILSSLSELSLPELSNQIRKLQKQFESWEMGKTINDVELLSTFIKCIEIIDEIDPLHTNVIIVLDELGKSLEFAAQDITYNDIGILQNFAELANRSHGKFLLITVLHQAFNRYAETLNPIQQQEWAKVQGRFENIGFLESSSEILNLLQQAIRRSENFQDCIFDEDSIMPSCDEMGEMPVEISEKLDLQILKGCLPLHPITAMLLSRLFRSFFAQNERSLFAFISSQEPFGFQSFLKSTEWELGEELPLYRLTNLFDYLASSFGSSLYTLGTVNKWAEVNDALERLPSDATKIDADLIKTVGLLELFGDQQLTKASLHNLCFSMSLSVDEIDESLTKLRKLGIIVFREFKQAYGFWQGSDIDLAKEFSDAFTKIDRSSKLSNYVNSVMKIDPYVARRHQFNTGTLRYFEPIIIVINDIGAIHDLKSTNTDGGLLIIVIKDEYITDEKIKERIISVSNELENDLFDRTIFLIPDNLRGLREAYEEVITWRYVKNNTPALESDRIARKELSLHEHMSNLRLYTLLNKYFDPALAYNHSKWIYQGNQLFFKSSRDLRAKLSDIFDQVFYKSPIILNEIINHNNISAAASGARNALVDKLISNHHFEDLGIDGFPPEMSIYLSLIKQSGLHHPCKGTWVLCPDPSHDDLRIKPLWQGIEDFLIENSGSPIEVTYLYEFLKKPPYGLKEGVLPIYLIICLIHWESQIAIYEENTYIPQISTAICERLIKMPSRFKVQMFPVSNSNNYILHRYTKLFIPDVDPNTISLVSAVQPLMRFVNRLPNYSLKTSRLGAVTQKMRSVLVTAKNPQKLLVKDLPDIFGFSFEDDTLSQNDIESYFEKINLAILEIDASYENLLKRIFSELTQIFFLPEKISEARNIIADRSLLLRKWVDDLNIKSFLLRCSDQDLDDRKWLESLGAVLTNVPPKNWGDQYEITFRIELRKIAARLNEIEEILIKEGELNLDYNDKVECLRIGISDIRGNEVSKVLIVNEKEKVVAEKLRNEFLDILSGRSESNQLKIYTLSEIIEDLINQDGREETNRGE